MKFQLNGSVIRLLLVTGAAFFVFFVLSTNQPSLQSSQFFFSNILNALIGATVVALVTSALFGYQAKIQADDEKKLAPPDPLPIRLVVLRFRPWSTYWIL